MSCDDPWRGTAILAHNVSDAPASLILVLKFEILGNEEIERRSRSDISPLSQVDVVLSQPFVLVVALAVDIGVVDRGRTLLARLSNEDTDSDALLDVEYVLVC